MKNEDKSTGWHPTSDSASGIAHYWETEKYSRRRSLCGQVSEAKLMLDASKGITNCSRCLKSLEKQERTAALAK